MYVFGVFFKNRLFIVWPYVVLSYIYVLYMHVAIQRMTIIITSLSRILWSVINLSRTIHHYEPKGSIILD